MPVAWHRTLVSLPPRPSAPALQRDTVRADRRQVQAAGDDVALDGVPDHAAERPRGLGCAGRPALSRLPAAHPGAEFHIVRYSEIRLSSDFRGGNGACRGTSAGG